MDGRSPWIPGCGQKWAHGGSPGWCSQITLLMRASLSHPALAGGELSSPAAQALGAHPPFTSELPISRLLATVLLCVVRDFYHKWPIFLLLRQTNCTSSQQQRAEIQPLPQSMFLCLMKYWQTSSRAQSVYVILLFNMKKLFILSSFPPCGLMRWLSCDYTFLTLQIEHKMLTTLWLLSLGYRTEAVAGNTPPLLLLLFLADFSRITWAYCRLFAWIGYRGKNRLNQTIVETGFVS